MRIAILTAGGAGMFCGSCMHDNTLARALIAAGHEVLLVPCYTPIRVDEANMSGRRVFLGGVNLYLDHMLPVWRRMPRVARRLLDRPGVLRLVSRLSRSSDAAGLGELTIELLRGEHGPLAAELPPLVDYLADELRPEAIVFSNALLGGVLPQLRARFDGPIACLLQGDDVFLDELPGRHRSAAIALVSEQAAHFDGYLTHSRFYADYMAGYLSLPRERFDQVPLGIDADSYRTDGEIGDREEDTATPTIGYFARLAPEKGLHHFVDAAVRLQSQRTDFAVLVGGYRHPKNADYIARQLDRLAAAGVRLHDVGSPADHDGKVAALRRCDVFSVPTNFLEPKGLPVLEAIACGVPCVQPSHGAFPELIEATGGGVLVPPADPVALAAAWGELLDDPARRRQLAEHGRAAVGERYGMAAMAEQTATVLTALADRRTEQPAMQPAM